MSQTINYEKHLDMIASIVWNEGQHATEKIKDLKEYLYQTHHYGCEECGLYHAPIEDEN